MKINRFKYIKNTGRFYNDSAAGKEFTQKNVLFGFNARGKSTVVNILRSLKEDDPIYLQKKKTVWASENPQIEIIDETNNAIIFNGSSWNKSCSEIEIFDTKYISDNIIGLEDISIDQHRNLNTLLIGPTSGLKKRNVEELTKEINDLGLEKTKKTNFFKTVFGTSIELNNFMQLPEENITTIEKDLDGLRKEIFVLKNPGGNKSLSGTVIKELRNLDFMGLKKLLEQTFTDNIDLINNHIESNIINNKILSKEYLVRSIDYMDMDTTKWLGSNCVLCGSKLDNQQVELFKSYKQLVSTGYRKFIDEINSRMRTYKEYDTETVKESLTSLSTSTDSLRGIIDVNSIEKAINILSDYGISKLKDKLENVETVIDTKDVIAELDILADLEKTLATIITYEEADKEIIRRKENTISKKEISLKRQLKIWKNFCSEYTTLETNSEKLKKQRDNIRDQLIKEVAETMVKHQKTINELLKEMNADYQITEMKYNSKIAGMDPIFSLMLFEEHPITLFEEDTNIYSIKATLSDSDKRILAIALFISMLINDTQTKNKLVVFDDPFSSLDDERKLGIARCLSKLVNTDNNPKQLIITSHSKEFVLKLMDEINDLTVFKIEEEKDNNHKISRIKHADISADFPNNPVIERLKKLREMHKSEKYEKDSLNIGRKVVEELFEEKYSEHVSDLEKYKIKERLERLKDHGINNYNSAPKYKDFKDLVGYLNVESHKLDSGYSQGDYKTIFTLFFKCIELI